MLIHDVGHICVLCFTVSFFVFGGCTVARLKMHQSLGVAVPSGWLFPCCVLYICLFGGDSFFWLGPLCCFFVWVAFVFAHYRCALVFALFSVEEF